MLKKIIDRVTLRFEPQLEKKYAAFVLPHQVATVRYIFIIFIFLQVALIVVELNRSYDSIYMIIMRSVMTVLSVMIIWVSYKRQKMIPTLMQVSWGLLGLLFFSTVKNENTPSFFLTNALVTFFYGIFTMAATRFRFDLIAALIALITFLIYIASPGASRFHISQTPNVTLNFALALAIGFYWEKQKRDRFLRQEEIDRKIMN